MNAFWKKKTMFKLSLSVWKDINEGLEEIIRGQYYFWQGMSLLEWGMIYAFKWDKSHLLNSGANDWVIRFC